MTIIGFDGCQLIMRMPIYEYQRMVKALANLVDEDEEE